MTAYFDRLPLSSTKFLWEALDTLSTEERGKILDNVANALGNTGIPLENVLDVYRNEVPGFTAMWLDLEAAGDANSRRAALEHILAERYGSKLDSSRV